MVLYLQYHSLTSAWVEKSDILFDHQVFFDR